MTTDANLGDDTTIRLHPGLLTPESVAVGALQEHPDNPRRGDIDAIDGSLTANGLFDLIKVQRSTGYILSGNHTYRALVARGATTVPAAYLDVDDTQALAIMAAANHTHDRGGYDDDGLLALLNRLEEADALTASSYDADELATLRVLAAADAAETARRARTTDPDDAPDVEQGPTRTAVGDVWALGDHRLVVGDAADGELVDSAFAAGGAHAMWTDPPYGVDYNSAYRLDPEKARLAHRRTDGKTIQNDGKESLDQLLAGFLAVAGGVLQPGSAAYIAHPSGPLSLRFGEQILHAGWSLRQQLVWVKDVFVMGRADYHYRHEPIWLAYTPGGDGRLGRGGERWRGNNAAQSVFEIPRPRRSTEHPTMKPVALITAMLANHVRAGDAVYDPFAGSGSTLIACHDLGAVARCIEIDPRYADVILRRFEDYTSITPTRITQGVPGG